MQVVVLLLLVAGLALLVLGLITASTPLVLASAAASLLAGYAISRYRRRQEATPAIGTPAAGEPAVGTAKPAGGSTPPAAGVVGTRTSSAVTVAELARAVAAERAAAGEPPLALGRASLDPTVGAGSAAVTGESRPRAGRPHDEPVDAEPAVRAEVAGAAGPAHAAAAVRTEPAVGPVHAGAAPAQAGTVVAAEPTQAAAATAPASAPDLRESVNDDPGSSDLDPPIAETDPPLRSRGAESVWVIDGRPRYHLSGCGYLRDRAAEPVTLRQAVEDGFTPCGLCDPDTGLAAG